MKRVEIEDIRTYTFYGNLQCKGESAVFTASRADETDNRYRFWLQDLHDGTIRDLTDFGSENQFLLADENTVYFTGNRRRAEGKTCLYEMHLDGGEAREIACLEKESVTVAGKAGNTLILQIPDRLQKEEKDYEVFDELPFYLNGSGIINKLRTHLYLYDLQDGSLFLAVPEDMDTELVFVQDDTVYFTGAPVGVKRPMKNGVYALNLQDRTLRTLVEPDRLAVYDLAWVKDRLLLMASTCSRYGLNENPWLYSWSETDGLRPELEMDLAFTNTTGTDCRLIGGNSSCVYQDAWYFLATVAENVHLFCYDGKLRPVLEWKGSIDSFGLSAQGVLFLGAKPAGLQQLYRYNGHGCEQISRFHPWTEDTFISLPQPVSYPGADGTMLEGWVLYPKDFDPEKSYPGILDIHGGPKTVYSTIFYHEMQVWASRGFFVFFCNPHGSDGFGNEFADLRGKYGTIDYQDLMSFTDTVLKTIPQIDPRRLGVTGGSYGGFMTNWIIGHTNRFAAAATQRSISNWISFFGTSDIGPEFVRDQQGAGLEHPEKLWEQSPLKYISAMHTPTLIIHSDEDYRCPLEQGEQLVTALMDRDVPTRLCLFHGENHDLSRRGKPDHRIRRLKEITNWMETYVQ